MQITNRTVRNLIGIGTRSQNKFVGVQYSWNTLNVFDDKNYTNYFPQAHPQMDGVMFWDEKIQPSYNKCLGLML